ncbi:sigma-70 family RNA polymerase sigma factor [Eubacteriales bacterium OttesenSCG-928-N13]|nr:sigma-70 family RNA polymerase sigma factor [Eubacteriales bacterium OttesenSCG-928-N13]
MIYYIPWVIFAIDNEADRDFMLQLYKDHHPIMIGEARRMLRSDDHSEDMVSDACIALIAKIKTLRSLDPCKLRAYVVSTIRNTCLNYIKKRDRQAKYMFWDSEELITNVESDEPDTLDLMVQSVEIASLKTALKLLPERQCTLLQLKYYDRLSDQEIGDLLSINSNSVRSALTTARRNLVKLMEQEVGV